MNRSVKKPDGKNSWRVAVGRELDANVPHQEGVIRRRVRHGKLSYQPTGCRNRF